MESENKVEYIEPISLQLSKLLRSKGFDLADEEGVFCQNLKETDSFGILYNYKEPKKYLFGLITTNPKRMWIGNIYFKNQNRGAEPNTQWVFEVYGRNNIEYATRLANNWVSLFDIKIVVHLKSEHSKFENFYL